MSYYDDLKDPRWQRRRLEIMNKYDFACFDCRAKDKQLNVHHVIYHKNKKLWDYDDRDLTCLCEQCHKMLHHNIEWLTRYMATQRFSVVHSHSIVGHYDRIESQWFDKFWKVYMKSTIRFSELITLITENEGNERNVNE